MLGNRVGRHSSSRRRHSSALPATALTGVNRHAVWHVLVARGLAHHGAGEQRAVGAAQGHALLVRCILGDALCAAVDKVKRARRGACIEWEEGVQSGVSRQAVQVQRWQRI